MGDVTLAFVVLRKMEVVDEEDCDSSFGFMVWFLCYFVASTEKQ